jgi:tetratricopeptide (TPR) repeat protein
MPTRSTLFLLIVCISVGLLMLLPGIYQGIKRNVASLDYLVQNQNTPLARPAAPNDHPRSAYWQALTALQGGNPELAAAIIEPSANSGDSFAMQISAQASETQEDYLQAAHIYTQLGAPEALYRVAQAATQAGDLEAAYQAYYAHWELDLVNGTLRLGDFLWQVMDNPLAAENIFREALQHPAHPNRRIIWYRRLASVLNQQKRWSEAVEVLESMIVEFPDDFQAHVSLGRAYKRAGYQSDVVVNQFQRAINLAPEQGNGYYAMGYYYAQGGNLEEADSWFREAIQRNPKANHYYLSQAIFHLKAGNTERAEEILGQAINAIADNHAAHYQLASVYLQDGRLESAIAAIETAVSLEPTNPEYYLLAGEIYEAAKYLQKAEIVYRNVLDIKPDDHQAKKALDRLTEKKDQNNQD